MSYFHCLVEELSRAVEEEKDENRTLKRKHNANTKVVYGSCSPYECTLRGRITWFVIVCT